MNVRAHKKYDYFTISLNFLFNMQRAIELLKSPLSNNEATVQLKIIQNALAGTPNLDSTAAEAMSIGIMEVFQRVFGDEELSLDTFYPASFVVLNMAASEQTGPIAGSGIIESMMQHLDRLNTEETRPNWWLSLDNVLCAVGNCLGDNAGAPILMERPSTMDFIVQCMRARSTERGFNQTLCWVISNVFRSTPTPEATEAILTKHPEFAQAIRHYSHIDDEEILKDTAWTFRQIDKVNKMRLLGLDETDVQKWITALSSLSPDAKRANSILLMMGEYAASYCVCAGEFIRHGYIEMVRDRAIVRSFDVLWTLSNLLAEDGSDELWVPYHDWLITTLPPIAMHEPLHKKIRAEACYCIANLALRLNEILDCMYPPLCWGALNVRNFSRAISDLDSKITGGGVERLRSEIMMAHETQRLEREG